ncbi:MAG: phosphatase PAP2 family protein [Anaerolineae bacterium]|nr:phosphatase PAP2 family protein [Anaerolineae bacterium]
MSLVYAIDYWLFAAINGLAGRYPWLDGPARLLLNDYFVPTVLALALLALWFESKDLASLARTNQRAVLAATLSAVLANIILKGLNLLYFRPRPFAQHAVNLLFYHPTDSSFPSNAAALGFAIAAGVWFYNRAWGGGLLVIAGLFGLSRIFGGVHYPLDLLAGAAMGWSSAYIIYRQTCLLNRLLGFTVTLADKLRLL